MKFAKIGLIPLAVVVLSVVPANLESCGPFFREAVFTLSHGPLKDAPEYAKGRLGVVLPSFDRKYLVVAFRYFSGVPLTLDESAAFLPKRVDPTPTADPANLWMEARTKAGAPSIGRVDTYRQLRTPNSFAGYENCLADAFRNATATLAKRTALWGAASSNLKEWIAGQDQVFSNCSGPRAIPGPVSSTDPVLLADRQYQIAAAAFYAGDWQLARDTFDQVAANSASPWREIAPYLKARVAIREGTVGGQKDSLDRAKVELSKLKTPLNVAALAEYVDAYAHPEDRLRLVGDKLSKPESGAEFANDLTDFIFLYDKLRGDANRKPVDSARASELADWIDTFQLKDHSHAVERWRVTGKLPWLVAAAVHAEPKDSDLPDLTSAIAKLNINSPASATLNFYAARWEIANGQAAAARRRIDGMLKQSLDPSSRNLFLESRMELAENWTDFLKYGPRVPTGQRYSDIPGEEESDWTDGNILDADSVGIFNQRVPLSLWIDAARSPLLPPGVRQDIMATAWTRAIVLGKAAEANQLATMIRTQRTELSEAMKAYLASDSATARFAAIYIILKNPGFSPFLREGFGRPDKIGDLDQLRDNYSWTANTNEKAEEAAFLPGPARNEGEGEAGAIANAAPHGTNYVALETLSYIEAHPNDPRAAESLALVVRATHYSITNEQTGPLSKRAFDLLHKNYPGTRYARETRYWYK